MSEVTAFRNNCLPYPVYGLPHVVSFPILDNTGSLVSGAAGLDSELSKNGDTFADATNEATEIGSSGMYYLSLIYSELQTQALTILVKTSTTNAKTTPMVLYPRPLVLITFGNPAGGSSSTVTLDSSAAPIDDFYNGYAVLVVIDGVYESRLVTDYNGSTKMATVNVNWVTADPDTDDLYYLYLPDGVQIKQANTTAWNTVQVATPATAGIPDVNTKNWNNLATVELPLVPTTAGRKLDVSTGGEAGVDWANIGSPTTAQGLSGTTIKTATDVETKLDALIATVGVAGAGLTAIATQVWASGTRTLTSFGSLVADIATAVWGATTRILTAGTNIVLAKGVGLTGLNDLSQADVRSAVGLASADLDTQLAALASLIDATATPAEVATAVAAALATTTYAEPTGVPANTISIQEKVGRIYQVLIDGLVVDSNTGEIQFKNAAGTVLWKKTFTDVASVYTESAKTSP